MKARDATLNTLANALNGLKLIGDPPTGVPLDEREYRMRFTEEKRSHSYYNWMVRGWQVKIYLAEGQRVIGFCKEGLKSARFADMALLHFWKYRIKTKRDPEDRDMNHGLAYAKKDMERNPTAIELLKALENHLRINYNLSPRGENNLKQKADQLVSASLRMRDLSREAVKLMEGDTSVKFKIASEMLLETVHQLEKVVESVSQCMTAQPMLDAEKAAQEDLKARQAKQAEKVEKASAEFVSEDELSADAKKRLAEQRAWLQEGKQ